MTLVFIDFEASGLGPESWPIEIGIAWLDGNRIEVRASLIRPHPDWPDSAWSPESARVHGIARDALDVAPTANAVAGEYAAFMARAIVLSDAPEFDGRWWRRLEALLDPTPNLIIGDFEVEAFSAFKRTPAALDRVFKTCDETPAPHRAGPDSQRLAKAWREGVRRTR